MPADASRPLDPITPSQTPRRQTLLFDADDTLWENNIFFERAIAAFISFLDHTRHTPAEVREHLNRVERRTIAERGYGTDSFRISLVRCFEELAETPVTEDLRQRIKSFADIIINAGLLLLPGVAEALPRLARHHRLLLVTKGDDLEQRAKLQQSGLEPLFSGVEVLPEKTVAAYRELSLRHACDLRTTWMIGNSPKSDINPALAAGLNAIFIPHSDTWILEHESLAAAPPGQHFLHLSSISDIAPHLDAREPLLYSTSD